MHAYRTHSCGALRLEQVGSEARLSGWVHRKRDHGQLLFIDLRDHYGVTQCVIDVSSALFPAVEQVRLESVVTVTGQVVARSKETVNPLLPTGAVELQVRDFTVLSAADPLPLQVNAEREENEEIRLRYRFLDLRREHMHRNITLRSQVIQSIRRRMIEQGFTEFQTPILTASSPEGARDYLVPSRIHPGKFYALPQAPQQFKQLLMVAGFDRYFQIAPCFRDEDARADRSPGEFYQLDFEMSYVTQEDVFAAIEPVLAGVFEEFGKNRPVTAPPFPRIPYDEALLKYGTDKPDLRNPLVIHDATDLFAKPEVEFRAFKTGIEKGGVVRAIPAPGAAAKPRSWFDRLNDWAKELGAPGLGYVTFEEETVRTPDSVASAIGDAMEQHGVARKGELEHLHFITGRGPIAKFLPVEVVRELAGRCGLKAGDAVFFVCDKIAPAQKLAGLVRTRLGEELDRIARDRFGFCWIVDFPMYELNEDTGQIEFSHNPFSMPQGGLEALETRDPLTIKAFQYDIVCNGVELSSGAIRNHKPEIMLKAFEIAGYGRHEVEQRFGGMFSAFKFGAPPHGGSAPGIDRIVMLLADEPNLREVIPFPMTQQAEDLMMGAPAPVDPKRLRELHLKLDLPPAKKTGPKEA